MIVIVTGANGMLGQALVRQLSVQSAVEKVYSFDIDDFDIRNYTGTLEAVSTTGAEVLVNCAAYTSVDRAEDEPELAMSVNVIGARNIARACQSNNIRMIHISTEYVFNGKKKDPYLETDIPSPVSVYGGSKEQGERETMEHCPSALIIRSSWLYGPGGKNFVDTILAKARNGEALKVVDDQFGAPTYTIDLAQAIVELLAVEVKGILNVVNSGECTWYQFACEIVRLDGLQKTLITPCDSSEYILKAVRPQNSRLNTSLLKRTLGHNLRQWAQALKDYFHLMEKLD